MSIVLKIDFNTRISPLRTAYRESLREALEQTPQFDKTSARAMVAYLTAAALAFQVGEDFSAYEACKKGSKELLADWQGFRHWAMWVHDQLGRPSTSTT